MFLNKKKIIINLLVKMVFEVKKLDVFGMEKVGNG